MWPERHDGSFSDAPFVKVGAFDEADVSDKPAYVSELPSATEGYKASLSKRHRERMRSMLTVADAVRSIEDALRAKGELEDTVFFLTSDNGYHLGSHRLPPGKQTPYVTDHKVPLAVWGAGVEAGKRGHLVSNADLAPTILSLAGVPYDASDFDGSSFVGALDGTLAPDGFRKIQLFEEWTTNDPTPSELVPATYSGIRTMAGKTFTRYATGETEHYDLEADPSQVKKFARAHPATADALDAKRATLAACSGDSCKTADGSAGP